jgi:cytochrome c556
MLILAKTMKSLSPMMKGSAPYDPDSVIAAAREIQTHSGENLTELFPKGSNDMTSEATEAVWSNPTGFADLAHQLSLLAQGLERAAPTPPNGQSMAPQKTPTTLIEISTLPVDAIFMSIGKTCVACHADYRIKK